MLPEKRQFVNVIVELILHIPPPMSPEKLLIKLQFTNVANPALLSIAPPL